MVKYIFYLLGIISFIFLIGCTSFDENKSDFNYRIVNNEVIITGWAKDTKDDTGKSIKEYPHTMEIPSHINGYPVTVIGEGAFANSVVKKANGEEYSIINVILPDTIRVIRGSAFANSNLENINIPNSVETIENEVFKNTNIARIHLGKNVKSIETSAFKDNNLNSIFVDIENHFFSSIDGVLYNKEQTKIILYPERKSGSIFEIISGVIEIGPYSFSRSIEIGEIENLEKIIMNNSVTTIGDSAFFNCQSLSLIDFSSNIVNVGRNAFQNTKWFENQDDGIIYIGKCVYTYKGRVPHLGTVIIDEGIKTIADYAFYAQHTMKSLVMSNSIEVIGKSAFEHCLLLEEIKFSNNLKYIGDNSFFACTELKEINLPDSLISIGKGTFKYCRNIEKINIPKSVESIENNSFQHTKNLKEITVCKQNIYFKSLDGVLYNYQKTELIKYPEAKIDISFNVPSTVKVIGAYAFYDAINLEEIFIPSSVKEINEYSFAYTNIENIYLFKNLITIKQFAFYGCSNLEHIYIPSSVESIGFGILLNCDNLIALTVPFIGDGSRYHHLSYFFGDYNYANSNKIPSSLQHITILGGAKEIGPYAFYDCQHITDINLPDTIVTINEWAFFNCSSLQSIVLPTQLKEIKKYAFYKSSLLSIIIPNNVKSIGEGAFRSSNVANAELPSQLEKLENYLFWDCRNLTSINIPNSVVELGVGVFKGCSSLEKVIIPNKIKKLSNYLFLDATNLKTVILNDGLEEIGFSTFANCINLTSIELPKTLQLVNKHAFSNCSNLSIITIKSKNLIEFYEQGNNFNITTFYVYEHLVDLYLDKMPYAVIKKLE